MKESKHRVFARLTALLLVLALAVVLGVFSVAAETQNDEPVCYNHGDVNGDEVVDNRDAIYTLYHVIFGDEEYPVVQDWDFNGDESRDNQDAIYLLYAYLFSDDPDYQLDGEVHGYYDPTWNWTEITGGMKAEVTFKCTCSEPHTIGTANGVTVKVLSQKAAGCYENGYVEYEAKVTFEGNTYSATYKQILSAAGAHQYAGTQSCLTGATCTKCGATLEALGHSWVLDEELSVEATCKEKGVQVYVCRRNGCQAENRVDLEKLPHTHQQIEDIMVGTCGYTKQFKCVCGDIKTGETYYVHNYSAALTKEANCKETGTKTYTCTDCGGHYNETVPVNDSHDWDSGVTANGITTFTCQRSGCGKTKTAVCTTENEATVSKDELVNSELQLGSGASLDLDSDTLDGLSSGNLVIKVEQVDKSEATSDTDVLNQIGGDYVYDFSLSAGGNAVSDFAGEITISLPYTLQPGEDVDNINVWYIADDGDLESIKATYSNGFVTFKTSHFSYYTVTRLTPAQRCELYGHSMLEKYLAPSCTADGYDIAICQRCGMTEKNEVLFALPHAYNFTRKAATCEQDGYQEKKCPDCGLTVKTILSKLDHDLHIDREKSVAATCTAAGKEVYTCANSGCTYVQEKSLLQLDHNYKRTEAVAATCTAKGYEKYVCSTCNDEQIRNEKAALGHSYEAKNVAWTWSDDHTTATATLRCSHDLTHTKAITAVVTEKTESATCLSGGAVTYNAAASYNMVTYTDKVVVTTGTASHKTDSQWTTNANQHYHVCQSCNGKVDAADHNWSTEVTVTKEATCVENGVSSVKCTVCGYVKETSIPATGEHDLVYGKCRNCDFEEDVCTHVRMYEKKLDLSQYNICPGAEFYLLTCDCGEQSCLQASDIGCKMEETEKQETLEDGSSVYTYTSVCSECGLTAVVSQGMIIDAEKCLARFEISYKLSVGSTVIAETSYMPESEVREHPTVKVVSKVDLTEAQYGLCGEVLMITTCPCGQKTAYVAEETCDWEPMMGTKDSTIYKCRSCGAQMTETSKSEDGELPCQIVRTYTTTYAVGGKDVYSYSNTRESFMHNNEPTDIKMVDESSCEEGVYVKGACLECGEPYEEYYEGHRMAKVTETDLSAYNLCASAHRQLTCMCGQYEQSVWFAPDGETCQWHLISEDAEAGITISACGKCGVIRKEVKTYSEKDENCYCDRTVTYTYTDANNNVIVSGFDVEQAVKHNYEYEYERKGESCTDGVDITQTCADCGEHYSYTEYYHVDIDHERYDLTQLGTCYSYAELSSCPCGERTNIHWYGDACDWTWIEGGRNYYTEMCTECGIVRTIRSSYEKMEEACAWKDTETVILSRGGEELLTISYSHVSYSHRVVHNVKLNEGATSCEDGYTVTGSCIECGMDLGQIQFPEDGYAHRSWIIERELVLQGKLCGDIDLVTRSCACGQETDQSTYWIGTGCDFYENDKGYYDPKVEEWIHVCSVCGAETWTERTSEKVEGTTCDYQRTYTYNFRRDGEKLGSYTVSGIYKEHLFVFSYDIQGESCEDGYYVTAVCADCGEAWSEEPEFWNWHEVNPIKMETICDVEGSCGEIRHIAYSCACGREAHDEVYSDCRWEHMENPGKYEGYFQKCATCGLQRQIVEDSRFDRENCERVTSMTHTYTMNDMEPIVWTGESRYKEHTYVSSFQLLGQTCADGYYLTQTCYYCQASQSYENIRTEEDTYCVAYYDLTDYGMCGGHVVAQSCACGAKTDWGWDVECETQYSEKGNYCADCNTYFSSSQSGSVDTTVCQFKGTYSFKAVRNDETVLDISGSICRPQHEVKVEGYTLLNPEGSCDDGVEAYYVCVNPNCTYSSQGTYYHHQTVSEKEIDLKEALGDVCGGKLYEAVCACGFDTEMRWISGCQNTEYSGDGDTNADGTYHGIHTTTCKDCGLVVVEKEDEVKAETGCTGVRTRTITAKLGDKETSVSSQREYPIHAFGDYTYTLVTEGTSCEDGVRATRTCADCQYSETGTNYYHGYNVVQSYDLTNYGSVCGGKLNLLGCPCGKYQEYEIDEATKCDIDEQWTELFVENVVTGEQLTTDGMVYFNNYAHTHICAVNEPQECGLSMKMAQYWKKEGCTAVEYQTWILNDGTEEVELTIKTGYRHTYHNFTADTSVADTVTYTCTDCGSTATRTQRYQNGYESYLYEHIVNTLENGLNKEYTQERIYGVTHNGYAMITQERVEYVYADGTTYWTQDDFTYASDTSCECTVRCTDSTGMGYSYPSNGHKGNWFDNRTEPTCSQPGVRNYGYNCGACGATYYTGSEILEPAHSWNDPVDGIYTCGRCGLQSTNNASGVIVMEDLTDTLGGGTHYVIGYYKKKEIQVNPTVSLILDNVAEGENNQIILQEQPEFIWLTKENDGVCAIKVDKATVDAMLAAALPENYTGTYALRISMVPVGGSELDYAITFDSVEKQ